MGPSTQRGGYNNAKTDGEADGIVRTRGTLLRRFYVNKHVGDA
jgi:hypothetical protein